MMVANDPTELAPTLPVPRDKGGNRLSVASPRRAALEVAGFDELLALVRVTGRVVETAIERAYRGHGAKSRGAAIEAIALRDPGLGAIARAHELFIEKGGANADPKRG